MKMISSTSTTSTSGVMLIVACIFAGSPSRLAGSPSCMGRHLDLWHLHLRPGILDLWEDDIRYLEQAVHELRRRPVHLDVEVLEPHRELVERDNGRNRDE